MGFLGSLFRTGKLNADLEQQALARALIDSVEHNRGFAKEEVFKILARNRWSRSEQRNRLAHAASISKISRADLYPRITELAKDLYGV